MSIYKEGKEEVFHIHSLAARKIEEVKIHRLGDDYRPPRPTDICRLLPGTVGIEGITLLDLQELPPYRRDYVSCEREVFGARFFYDPEKDIVMVTRGGPEKSAKLYVGVNKYEIQEKLSFSNSEEFTKGQCWLPGSLLVFPQDSFETASKEGLALMRVIPAVRTRIRIAAVPGRIFSGYKNLELPVPKNQFSDNYLYPVSNPPILHPRSAECWWRLPFERRGDWGLVGLLVGDVTPPRYTYGK